MHNFKSFLDEGKNDKAIFHVIFMAGGPGSGKSYINKKLGLRALNFVDINSDSAFEQAMKKSLLDLNMPAGQDYARDIVRGLAKKTTMKKKGHAVDGRLGMVIDGTGAKANAIKKMVDDFTKLGYETAMVFVDTDEQTALDRNNARERSLRPSLVTKMWKDVQSNKSFFQSLFGKRFWVIDNSTESNPSAITKVYSRIAAWSSKLPNNPQVKAWMDAN
jgi:predicted kinase